MYRNLVNWCVGNSVWRTNECPVMMVNDGVINEIVGKYYYDRMHERVQTRKVKILMKKRQSTVESVIGTLVVHFGKSDSSPLISFNQFLTDSKIWVGKNCLNAERAAIFDEIPNRITESPNQGNFYLQMQSLKTITNK